MIELDARVAALAVLAFIATAAVPAALGGGVLVAGLAVGLLAGRSVLRAEEADVTTAIIAGGLLVAIALTRGHHAAFGVCAGVFAGAEVAALGRRLGLDHDAPAGPEVAISASTIGLGLVAGAVVALVGNVRAAPVIANIALVAAVIIGVTALAARRLRS